MVTLNLEKFLLAGVYGFLRMGWSSFIIAEDKFIQIWLKNANYAHFFEY